MSRYTLYTQVLQDESLKVGMLTTLVSLTCTGGDSPCTGRLQLKSLSEGLLTYLVSSVQMTLRKACSDTEFFPRLPRGSNPWPLELKASALTTRQATMLPCSNLNFERHNNHLIEDFSCESFGYERAFVFHCPRYVDLHNGGSYI